MTQRQLTRPAVMRDASSRHPHIATKAYTPPQTKREFCPGETETPGKENILREERPRGREFESYFNLKILVGPTGICTPYPHPHPPPMPLGSSSRVWKALAAFPDPHSSLLFSSPTSLSLLPPAMRCIVVGGGMSVAMAGARGGTEETFSFVLPYSPVHEAFHLPASSLGPSYFSYDPHLSVHFTLGTPVSSTCPLSLLCCPLSPPVLA